VPDLDTVRDELTLRAVRGLGIAHPRWAPDYYRLPKTGMAGRLARLAAEGRLQTVEVEGWDVPGYVHPERAALLDEVAGGRLVAEHTALLSPFDPLVWDRERARSLFGFDYSIECYLPAEKRKYGYFSLPILWRGLLAGRLDAKAHRKDGLMEIKSLYLEPGVSLSDALVADLGAALRGFAAWHGTPEVAVRRSEPEAAAGALAAAANG
jgi:uncharacterized protein YcaQ